MVSNQYLMDKVTIKGLSFHAKHGCHKEERLTGGNFEADIDIYVDNSTASKTDKIEDAVDYVRVMEIAERVFSQPKNLIESVASTLCEELLKSFSAASRIDIQIKKLAPPVRHQLEYVAVSTSIERKQNN